MLEWSEHTGLSYKLAGLHEYGRVMPQNNYQRSKITSTITDHRTPQKTKSSKFEILR